MRQPTEQRITLQQFDGTTATLAACTCEPAFVADYQRYNTSCPIDRHAQRARQDTWEFDDNGNTYTDTTD